jgi:hypothetical protein
MTKEIPITNHETATGRTTVHLSFIIRHSLVIMVSSLVIHWKNPKQPILAAPGAH